MKRSFSIEQDREIARLYQEGLSSIKLAQRYGVDKSTILGALKRQGVKRRDNRTFEDGQEKKIVERYLAGESMYTLGLSLGVSNSTIADILDRHNTPKRDDRFAFTEDQEKRAAKLYQSGLTIKEVAHQMGSGIGPVYGALEKYNITPRDGRLFTDEEEEEIAALYLDGQSPQQIADDLGVSRKAIINAIERQQVEKRPGRVLFFDEQAFDNLDNEQSLYWLGFAYADGNVTPNELRFGLSLVDLDHLKRLKEFLKSGASIRIQEPRKYDKYATNGSCSVGFASVYMANKLLNLGLGPRRGNFYKLKPHIPKAKAHHFIRGYLDGDGCISTNQQVVFLGQPDILEWIKQTLHEQAQASLNNKIRQRRGIYEVSWGGINQVKKIIEYLYRDATIYLERKKDIADSWK